MYTVGRKIPQAKRMENGCGLAAESKLGRDFRGPFHGPKGIRFCGNESKTNGSSVAAVDSIVGCYETMQEVDGLEEVLGGGSSGQEVPDANAHESYLFLQSPDLHQFGELLGGEIAAVEASFAGVLIAGLGARLPAGSRSCRERGGS